MHGIVGYGSYVPRFRIKAEDIANQWGADAEAYKRGLLLEEKTIPGLDEDTITISVAAARYAVDRAGIDPQKIGACYIGSESHPYAVKPSGTVLIDAIGAGLLMLAAVVVAGTHQPQRFLSIPLKIGKKFPPISKVPGGRRDLK
mgnify:CR=1 FL=1